MLPFEYSLVFTSHPRPVIKVLRTPLTAVFSSFLRPDRTCPPIAVTVYIRICSVYDNSLRSVPYVNCLLLPSPPRSQGRKQPLSFFRSPPCFLCLFLFPSMTTSSTEHKQQTFTSSSLPHSASSVLLQSLRPKLFHRDRKERSFYFLLPTSSCASPPRPFLFPIIITSSRVSHDSRPPSDRASLSTNASSNQPCLALPHHHLIPSSPSGCSLPPCCTMMFSLPFLLYLLSLLPHPIISCYLGPSFLLFSFFSFSCSLFNAVLPCPTTTLLFLPISPFSSSVLPHSIV